ncbi:MAG TPA: DUF4123 domain-containing protein [Planctomycetota bacterium]|nr:DUF4123 domain-containing protein [Planctomycetota bacterium]
MADEAMVQKLHQRLFAAPDRKVYALLDGASVKGLLDKLDQCRPEYVCLYRGELEPDMAEVAPYLVRLEPEAKFTQWLLTDGWGRHWGIFAAAGEKLRIMREHFRRFTMVRGPEDKDLYFRFYDPRVLRTFLPTCTKEELESFFGPVLAYVTEDEDPARMLRFAFERGALRREELVLQGG